MKTYNIPTEKTVAAFKDYDFDNPCVPEKYDGDYPHRNFFNKYFIPIVRSEVKKLAKKLGATVKFSYNNFEWTAFFSKNGKCVYVDTSDHRWNNWYDNVMYREAANDHDYHGITGNYWTPYNKLEETLASILG